MISLFLGVIFSTICIPLSAESIQTIPVHKLSFSPTLDGNDNEWSVIAAETVALNVLHENSVVEATEVSLKAGYNDDYIYFYFEWSDSEENKLHKPYVWDDSKNKYVRGTQREDRLALQLEMKGDFAADWRVGNDFVADMWHWKSVRSNPLGLVHDKMLTISAIRMLRSAEIAGHNGPVYVLRKSDAGDSIYTTKRYRKKDQPIMPKYILNSNPSGSIADIRAAGVWSNGRWHLELRRKLDTGHDDDAVFSPGQAIKGAVSIFDGSENHDHNYSSTLLFQL